MKNQQQKNWDAIDEAATQEGVSLDKMHKCTKCKRVKQQTSTYSEENFDKLFKKK